MLLLKKSEAQSDNTPSSTIHPAFPCQVSQTKKQKKQKKLLLKADLSFVLVFFQESEMKLG